jgi:hypothetical protein
MIMIGSWGEALKQLTRNNIASKKAITFILQEESWTIGLCPSANAHTARRGVRIGWSYVLKSTLTCIPHQGQAVFGKRRVKNGLAIPTWRLGTRMS